MKQSKVRSLCVCAMIAALYTAVSIALAMSSFGAVQLRVSEALTILPAISPLGIWGVTVGCLLTNVIGVGMGLTMAVDIVFGTAATLIAALLSFALRKIRFHGLPILSTIPPVLVNGVVIGLELTWLEAGGFSWALFWMNFTSVSLGQIVPCCVLGLLLYYVLGRTGLSEKLL
ncbi:MAG: QueT transporter family protein [Oscillospiraceae bacterium]|nr:QueT transporter family protein [Oscillospiraceae bacterium]